MTIVRIGLALVVLVTGVGCSTPRPNPLLAMRYEKGWEKKDLDSLIRRSGVRAVHVTTLGNTAWISHHVAVVRTEEKPHYHRFHDMTVTVLRGEGVLNVDTRAIRMKEGDVAHIHRGTPHFFRNTGETPAAAFVVFSPPFDGRDVVTARKDSGRGGEVAPDEEDGDPAPSKEKPEKSGWFW